MLETITYFAFLSKVNVEHALSFVTNFGAACEPGNDFIGFPTWYKYLEGEGTSVNCSPVLGSLNDVWLIVLAIVELLIRIAAIAAVIFIIIGGIKFMLARGNPEKITEARMAVINALVGLVIAVVAVAAINFLGNSF